MSRWEIAFNENPYFNELKTAQSKIEEALEKYPDNIEACEELIRIKSVLKFSEESLKSWIPELVPILMLNNLSTHLQKIIPLLDNFINNGNVVYLYDQSNPTNVNTVEPHLNNILNGSIAYGNTSKPNSIDIKSVSEEYNSYIKSFKENATSFVKTKKNLEETLQNSTKYIIELNNKLFGNNEDEESVKNSINSKITTLLDRSTKANTEIQQFYNELFTDAGNVESLKTKMQTFFINSKSNSEEINKLLDETQQETKDLKTLYKMMYGFEKEGVKTEGLKKEIEDTIKELADYEEAQETVHKTLMKRAEEQLDFTMTIGLSRAFGKLKGEFAKANRIWNAIFVTSLLSLLIVAYINTTSNDVNKNDVTKATQIVSQDSNNTNGNTVPDEWELILTKMLKSLPFYIPLVWLAVFSSRRRSENKRLEQEYAHKEAIAITYDSYKKQIEQLKDGENKELLLKLLNTAIDAVAYNASETLGNGKHDESTPSHDLIKEIGSNLQKLMPLAHK